MIEIPEALFNEIFYGGNHRNIDFSTFLHLSELSEYIYHIFYGALQLVFAARFFVVVRKIKDHPEEEEQFAFDNPNDGKMYLWAE